MLKEVKRKFGISSGYFDIEILELISDAVEDISLHVVIDNNKSFSHKKLYKKAVMYYCNAHFWKDESKFKKYIKEYEDILLELKCIK